MDKTFVSDLKEKQTLHSTFLAKNKTLLTDKKGNQYISLYLSDKSGSVDAKIWDNIERMNNLFESGDIVIVKGQVQMFQNKKQVVIHKIDPIKEESLNFEDYVGEIGRSPEEVLQELFPEILLRNAGNVFEFYLFPFDQVSGQDKIQNIYFFPW